MLTKTELDLNVNFILDPTFVKYAQNFLRINWDLLEDRDFSTFYDRALSVLNMSSFIVMIRHLMLCGIDTLSYVNEIPNYFFAWSNITQFDIPNHITSIGNSAFYDCEKLENIIIPNSVNRIWAEAFMLCESLESVVIPNSVVEIGNEAFEDCTKLKTVTISEKFKDRLDDIFGSERVGLIDFTFI